jgi:glycosyltransferase involved in cell wall biosynthesis
VRILQVDKFLDASLARAGGVGTYVRTLSEHLRRRGHEVVGFGCVADGRTAQNPAYFDFTRTRNPLALGRMIHNREAAEKLSRLLRRRPVDVAHLHNIYHHLTPSILPVLAEHGVAMVMTVHDYRLVCPTKHFLAPSGVCMRCHPNRFHACLVHCGLRAAPLVIESYVQRFWRRYLRWIRRFLCPSAFLREVLRQAGAAPSRLAVVRNFVAPAAIAGAAGEAGREVLFAGRLSAEKGPRLMLDLAARLDDVRVVIAGDGPLGEPLRQEARQRRLANVSLLGHVSAGQMAARYAGAAAVVIPSRCLENSPATMLEAMAARRCVIAADHPPLREWIRDGVTGRTFASGDGDDLARVTREVLGDASGRRRIAAAGRDLVARRHEPRAILDRIEALYREAAATCG